MRVTVNGKGKWRTSINPAEGPLKASRAGWMKGVKKKIKWHGNCKRGANGKQRHDSIRWKICEPNESVRPSSRRRPLSNTNSNSKATAGYRGQIHSEFYLDLWLLPHRIELELGLCICVWVCLTVRIAIDDQKNTSQAPTEHVRFDVSLEGCRKPHNRSKNGSHIASCRTWWRYIHAPMSCHCWLGMVSSLDQEYGLESERSDMPFRIKQKESPRNVLEAALWKSSACEAEPGGSGGGKLGSKGEFIYGCHHSSSFRVSERRFCECFVGKFVSQCGTALFVCVVDIFAQ